jgi:hypothetical protein
MSRYKPNHKSFARFMVSEQVREPVRKVAHLIEADAKADTPVRTGELASSYEVNDITVPINGDAHGAAEVRNTDRKAAANEFGNKRMPGRRMLGKAASKYGDQIGKREGI